MLCATGTAPLSILKDSWRRAGRVHQVLQRLLSMLEGASPSTVEAIARALRDGLLRCAELTDPEDRAWALRDTFDGLLDVIQRWLQARPTPASGRQPPPKRFLN